MGCNSNGWSSLRFGPEGNCLEYVVNVEKQSLRKLERVSTLKRNMEGTQNHQPLNRNLEIYFLSLEVGTFS